MEIVKNIAPDIAGEYPPGYFPAWEKIIRAGERPTGKMETVGFENLLKKNSTVKNEYAYFILTEKNNKPVLVAEVGYAEIKREIH